jgi:hypothetical protein
MKDKKNYAVYARFLLGTEVFEESFRIDEDKLGCFIEGLTTGLKIESIKVLL